ncbi:MAG: hypothetical protein KDD89_07065 [Anaerolineales bacterium]|nr:hypothetical protein [Anaerolineales bacterium]
MKKLLFAAWCACWLVACLPSVQAPPPATALPTTNPLPTQMPTAVPPTPIPTLTAVPLPPTATAVPTSTPQPTATATPTPLPTAVPPSARINDIPQSDFLWLPPETVSNVQNTFLRGQSLGRAPNRFSKLGDSLVAHPGFLTMFDRGAYNLGPYERLQPTIDYYADSYARYGVGLKIGLSSFGILDPFWADKEWCNPNEHLLACEIRLHNPSMLLIQMGTNDASLSFEENMREVLTYALDEGVVPVLITKADRFEGDNRNNEALRRLAAELNVPLLDFDLLADTLPGRGLRDDNAHLTVPDYHDYAQPETLTYGHGVHNLALLMMLDALREIVQA